MSKERRTAKTLQGQTNFLQENVSEAGLEVVGGLGTHQGSIYNFGIGGGGEMEHFFYEKQRKLKIFQLERGKEKVGKRS
jgi:hypothetical protein